MKRLFSVLLLAVFAALAFAACGSSSSASSALPAASSSLAASSLPASSASAAGQYDVGALLAPLTEAAGLGATIELDITELTASGDISADNIAAMAGAKSVMYAENGGMVAVIEATPGTADTVKAGLEKYRDGLLAQGEDYKSDFPLAYANMQEARIVVNGDCVIFATSANGTEGGYDALDTALAAAFA